MVNALRVACRTSLALAAGLGVAGMPDGIDALAGDAAAGREKAAACAVCHGLDGLSRQPDTPHIAGQVPFYLEDQLKQYRSGARVHPQMNVVSAGLSDADIADLVAYYSSIEVTVKVPE